MYNISEFMYVWIITWWVLAPVLCILSAVCYKKNKPRY